MCLCCTTSLGTHCNTAVSVRGGEQCVEMSFTSKVVYHAHVLIVSCLVMLPPEFGSESDHYLEVTSMNC